MKKLLLILLTCTLVSMCSAVLAQENRALVLFAPYYDANIPRAGLYASPDGLGDPVGYVFDQTWVSVSEDTGGALVRVRLGDTDAAAPLEGYIARFALRFGALGQELASLHSGAGGVTRPSLPSLLTPLFAAPSEDASVLAQLPASANLSVYALTGEWALVSDRAENHMGYVRKDELFITDLSYSELITTSPEQRVPLYARPDDPDSLLGEYYGCVTVYHLFDTPGVHSGFQLVKLGRVTGYLSSAVLHHWRAMDPPFLPPVCTTPAETALYAVPDAQSDVIQTVPFGTTLEVLGVYDAQGFYHVRWGALDAFVPKETLPDALQRSRETPPASADDDPYVPDPLLPGYRTLYIARPNTALRDSPSPDGAILHTFDGGGYQAMLLGGVLPSGYVRVLCQTDLFFEAQKSPPIEGYLPVDALTWDSGY